MRKPEAPSNSRTPDHDLDVEELAIETEVVLPDSGDTEEVLDQLERQLKSLKFFEKADGQKIIQNGAEVALKSFEAHGDFLREMLQFMQRHVDVVQDMDAEELWEFMKERYAEYLLR